MASYHQYTTILHFLFNHSPSLSAGLEGNTHFNHVLAQHSSQTQPIPCLSNYTSFRRSPPRSNAIQMPNGNRQPGQRRQAYNSRERYCNCKWITKKMPDETNKRIPVESCYKETCKYWRAYDRDNPGRYLINSRLVPCKHPLGLQLTSTAPNLLHLSSRRNVSNSYPNSHAHQTTRYGRTLLPAVTVHSQSRPILTNSTHNTACIQTHST